MEKQIVSEDLKTAYNFKRSQVQHKQYLREEKCQAMPVEEITWSNYSICWCQALILF